MKMPLATAAAALGVLVLTTTLNAQEVINRIQRNAVNVTAVVILDRRDDSTVVVDQSGLYNAAGVVSFGTGGYTEIYQAGQGNSALLGQFGTNQSAALQQMQNGTGIFSRFGSSRR